MEKVKYFGEVVVKDMNAESSDKISQEINQLAQEKDDIAKLIHDMEDLLNKSISSWDSFSTVLKAIQNWLPGIQKKASLVQKLFIGFLIT